jgi:membrane protein implicated in regulation of membrane protease activity
LAERSEGLLVVGKYLLLQVPGWVTVCGVAWAAHRWLGLDAWLAFAALAAIVVKDAVLFRYVRHAYAVAPRPAAASLLGARGVAEGPIAPEGHVRVGPERWRARLAPGASPIAAGAAVRVDSLEGLTLRVRGDGVQPTN